MCSPGFRAELQVDLHGLSTFGEHIAELLLNKDHPLAAPTSDVPAGCWQVGRPDRRWRFNGSTPCHGFLKSFLALISCCLTSMAVPVAAQTQDCFQRSEQLLKQLADSPARSIDAMAEKQRQQLRSQGCDPQTTGYDIEVESIKLNQDLDLRPRTKEPFRFDQLIKIDY